MVTINIYNQILKSVASNNLFEENDKILILTSLGKDATVLMDFFAEYQKVKKIEIIPVTFCVPNNAYLSYDTDELLEYWKSRNLNVQLIQPNIETKWENQKVIANDLPCSKCRIVRNEQIKLAIEKYKPTKVAAGFNFTDLQNYFINMMFISNFTFYNDKIKDKITALRFEHLIPRFFMLRNASFSSTLKWTLPLLTLESHAIRKYLEEKKIPYLKNKCNFKSERAKSLFENYIKKLHENYNFDVTYENLMKFLTNHISSHKITNSSDNWINENQNDKGD